MAGWSPLDRYGVFYEADPQAPNYRPEVLLVFVHGLGGHPTKTWGDLPFWLSERLGIESDMFSFGYDTGWLKRSDIRTAARDLRTALTETFKYHRHIFFVTHSTGGLVVKRLLVDETPRIEAGQIANDYFTGQLVVTRSRRIINFAVPHRGGKAVLTYFQALFAIFTGVTGLALALLNLVNQNRSGWGFNTLRLQLTHRNYWIMRLEAAYIALIAHLDQSSLPRPLSYEIMDPSDIAVNTYQPTEVEHPAEADVAIRTDFHSVGLRGTHSGIKIPQTRTDPMLFIVSDRLPLRDLLELTIADRTIGRVLALDEHEVEQLVGQADEEGEAEQRVETQQAAFGRLLEFLSDGNKDAILVTGPFGVGKSTVFRSLARHLAAEYLSGRAKRSRFALAIALQDLNLQQTEIQAIRAAKEPQDVWRAMSERLAKWGNDLMKGDLSKARWPTEMIERTPLVDGDWVVDRVERGTLVVLLDSIDEFLSSHQAISAMAIVRVIRHFDTLARSESTRLVLFVRDEHPATRILESECKRIRITPLSEAQADSYFSGSLNVMAAIDDKETRELYLRPFYLVHFKEHSEQTPDQQIHTSSDLTKFTLRIVLRKAVKELTDRYMAVYTADAWYWCLICVAWSFYRDLEGEMPIEKIHSKLSSIQERWRAFASGEEHNGEIKQLIGNVYPAEQEDHFRYVMDRTIFRSTGLQAYNLHQEWEDSLSALYVTRCFELENYREFEYRGITPNVQRSVATELGSRRFSARFIKEMSEAAVCEENPFLLGNFLAHFTFSRVQLEGPAVRLLYSGVDSYQLNLKHLLVSSTGTRALGRYLGGMEDDVTAEQIATEIIPMLVYLYESDACNGVTRSMAWCYHKALAQLREDIEVPATDWPGLGERAAEDGRDLATLVTTARVSKEQHQRSMQLGFMQSTLACLQPGQGYRALAAAHYLYLLSAAQTTFEAIDEVESQLREVFTPGNPVGAKLQSTISDFTLVPELVPIYDASAQVFAGLLSQP